MLGALQRGCLHLAPLHLLVQLVGCWGAWWVLGLPRAAASPLHGGARFSASTPAPAACHGQAATAAQAHGRASLYLWEGLRWARCPRGTSRPRMVQACSGRAFSFAFSFFCGKGGVEKQGGSAMAAGKVTSVLNVPGMRPARVGVRARSFLSSAV